MSGDESRFFGPAARLAWGITTALIALVWAANGLWAKILGGVPRHEAIVARVVDDVPVLADVAPALTVVIGFSELGMLAWFLSGRFVRACAVSQIAIVMTMNVIEQLVAPELLLFGPLNLVWATLFCAVVAGRTRLHLLRTAATS